MDLLLNDDQQAIASAVAQLIERHGYERPKEAGYVLEDGGLEAAVRNSGFLDVAQTEGYGTLEGLLVVEALARSPVALEAGASAVVAPGLGLSDLPRPLALIDADQPGPVRFLTPQGSALILTQNGVRRASGAELQVTPVTSPYAYPMGRPGVDLAKVGQPVDADPDELRRLWRLALGAEAIGLMRSALDIVVEHVKTRKQFGQPLGVFQVIQHRLSECEVLVRAGRLLLQEAAALGTAEAAAFAALQLQESTARLVYETHQFHGAIGLTLEYPLHYWTYRLRVLQGELGGVTAQALEASELAWLGNRVIDERFRGQDV